MTRLTIVLSAAVAVLAITLAAVAGVVFSDGGTDQPQPIREVVVSSPAQAPTTAAPKPAPATTVTVRPTPPTVIVRERTVHVPAPHPPDPYQADYDAFGLHPGSVCREMYARGWSWLSMWSWYATHGYPNHMDSDGDNIPCETVYP